MPYILALLIEEEPGMTARTRSHVVAIGTVLAGLVLVGCANPERLDRTTTPKNSLARVQSAAAKITEARSTRLSMTMRTTFAGEQVAASTATTESIYDYAAHKKQMDTTIKTAGIPFRFTVRTLVIGSTVYIKTPNMPHGQETPAGVPLIPEEHHKPCRTCSPPRARSNGSAPNRSAAPRLPATQSRSTPPRWPPRARSGSRDSSRTQGWPSPSRPTSGSTNRAACARSTTR